MMLGKCRFGLVLSFVFALLGICLTAEGRAQANSGQGGTEPTVVLVELFISEGCSDCPPEDELLRQVNGHKTAGRQMVVGISEHVSYWNSLGWKAPFSSELYTTRQNEYGSHFGLDSVYPPPMIGSAVLTALSQPGA